MAMTALQRLAAAATRHPADRIPIFCNLFDQGPPELGMSPRDYYARGAHVAEGQLRLREKYGYDNIWSLFYVGREAELLGCHGIHFADEGPPNVEHFVVESLDDIARLTVPDDIAAHPAFEQPAECLRLLREHVGGTYPICAYVTATMTLPALLMGMERWMSLLLMGPSGARDALLAKCHEFFVKEVQAYRAGGADLILYSNPFGSTDTVPMKFFLSQALPWIDRDIRAAGTNGLVYYCGTSRINRVLDIVLDTTGTTAHYLSPFDSIADAKEIAGGRSLTCGVINDARMTDWTPDDVVAEVKRMTDAGMHGGRFLIGTGVMPVSIPEANIRAYMSAAREFGCHDYGGRR